MLHTIRTWCGLACTRPVVFRGLKYAVVVGTVLVTINHGDAILRGDVDRGRFLRIALTVVVPYVVSALSSVGAMRHLQLTQTERASAAASPVPPPPSSRLRSRSSGN